MGNVGGYFAGLRSQWQILILTTKQKAVAVPDSAYIFCRWKRGKSRT